MYDKADTNAVLLQIEKIIERNIPTVASFLIYDLFKKNEDNTLFDGFWERLEMFVKDVKVNDPMSDEEKEMILRICKQYK